MEASDIKCKRREEKEVHEEPYNLLRDRDRHVRAVALWSNFICQSDTVKSWELKRRELSHCSFFFFTLTDY